MRGSEWLQFDCRWDNKYCKVRMITREDVKPIVLIWNITNTFCWTKAAIIPVAKFCWGKSSLSKGRKTTSTFARQIPEPKSNHQGNLHYIFHFITFVNSSSPSAKLLWRTSWQYISSRSSTLSRHDVMACFTHVWLCSAFTSSRIYLLRSC